MVRWPLAVVIAGIGLLGAPDPGVAALPLDRAVAPNPHGSESFREGSRAFMADAFPPDSAEIAADSTSVPDSHTATSASDTVRAGVTAQGGSRSETSGLEVVGGIALFELTAAAFSGIASDSPVGAGVLAGLASPVLYAVVRSNQPASVALVPAVAFGSLAIFNFVLSAGDYTDENLFTYNMIACNVVAGAGFLVYRLQTRKDSSGGGGNSAPPAWSVGFGPVGGAAGLRITRRF